MMVSTKVSKTETVDDVCGKHIIPIQNPEYAYQELEYGVQVLLIYLLLIPVQGVLEYDLPSRT